MLEVESPVLEPISSVALVTRIDDGTSTALPGSLELLGPATALSLPIWLTASPAGASTHTKRATHYRS